MVTEKSIREQLKAIGFNQSGWGRKEVRELPHILLDEEKIFECVNGIYEGGFALLVATDVRVLLVDKKPLNFLTVEDLRFDMINEIDYNHRLFGANISITSGDKNLRFRSYDQSRLRKLITHVQHCMADSKKKQSSHQEGQNQHLQQINQQLQAYLMAQYQHQQELHAHLKVPGAITPQVEPVKPSPELADYLFAQSLLAKYQEQTGTPVLATEPPAPLAVAPRSPEPILAEILPPPVAQSQPTLLSPMPVDPGQSRAQLQDDIYAEGIKEVFGRRLPQPLQQAPDISALKIAYSKLPTVLRHRKFTRAPL